LAQPELAIKLTRRWKRSEEERRAKL
jgi:hypothetical protein